MAQIVGEEHDHSTLVHIPLHAIHKYLYLDVLQAPERLEREMKSLRDSPAAESYVAAWEYVDTHDYKDIIEKIKLIY